MNSGKVVEFDHPFLLLAENNYDEEITKTKGIFATMVKYTGKKNA